MSEKRERIGRRKKGIKPHPIIPASRTRPSITRLGRGHYLQMNGRTGRSRIQRGNNEVVPDLRRGSNDYDFIFKNCAVGVVRFPKGRMENLPEGEWRISIIRAKPKEVIALVLGDISAASKFR